MDEKFQNILDTLGEKPPRSRLEPYSELIDELRRRGRTYREIAHILAENCGLKTAASTVHDFLRVRSGSTGKPGKPQPSVAPALVTGHRKVNPAKQKGAKAGEIKEKITALKVRAAPAKANPKRFHYNPDEPLHIPAKSSGEGTRG